MSRCSSGEKKVDHVVVLKHFTIFFSSSAEDPKSHEPAVVQRKMSAFRVRVNSNEFGAKTVASEIAPAQVGSSNMP